MPLLNRDLFADALIKNPILTDSIKQFTGTRGHADYYGYRRADSKGITAFKANPSRESAYAVLDELGDFVKSGGQLHKALRPWDINAAVFDHLDRRQPWWGWEFETGWASEAARKKALAHAWDSYDGVMFDGEGEGNWQVEITFTPSEARSHFDGTAPARQFVEWMSKNPKLVFNGGDANVGTHLNMSHPAITDHKVASRLTRFMNRTVMASSNMKGANRTLFGRETLYGGFYRQMSNGGKNNWLEFKGFRTTYDIKQFDSFLQSAAGLQVAMDYFLSLPENEQVALNAQGAGMANLFDVVRNGKKPEYGPVKSDGRHNYAARGDLGEI